MENNQTVQALGVLENLTVPQLVKNIPHIYYGNRSFIAAFTKAIHLSLPWKKSTQSNYFFKTCFNIILPSPPGSSQLCHLSAQKPCTHFCCLVLRAPTASPFWFDHPNNIWWAVRIVRTSLCHFLHAPVTSSSLAPDVSPSAHILPSKCETKLHTHLKQQPNY